MHADVLTSVPSIGDCLLLLLLLGTYHCCVALFNP